MICQPDHAASGRGQNLLTCGDVESNHGPKSSLSKSAKAAQTRCDAPPTENEDLHPPAASLANEADMDVGAAFLEENRSDAFVQLAPGCLNVQDPAAQGKQLNMMACPVDGCPPARQHLSKDSLVKHLGRVRAQAGQGIPQSVLLSLGYTVCTPWR